jgi:hypothetical protein
MTSTLATAFGFSSALLLIGQFGWRPLDPWARGRFSQQLSHLGKRPLGLGQLPLSLGLGMLLLGLGGCGRLTPMAPRQIVLKQAWEIESGDRVAGQLVTGSLGDISIRLQGARLRAPFTGQVEPAAKGFNCIYFSSPEVPAYLFRYCGVSHPHLGPVEAGAVMGRGRYIHFATLRRQPDGSWAMVEPSDRVLERSLNRPPPRLPF